MKRLEFNLTKQDLVDFNLYHSKSSPFHLKERRKARFMVPVIYIIFAITGYFLVDKLFASAFIVIAIAWYFLSPIWIERRYRKHYEKHVNEVAGDSLTDPVTIEITPDGIHSTSHLGEAKYKFSSLEKIVENDEYTYVFIGKGAGFILPHDRVSKLDIDEFIAEIREYRPDLVDQQPAAS